MFNSGYGCHFSQVEFVKRFSFCCKCAHRKTKKKSMFLKKSQQTIIGEELVGCKKLTKKKWDEGLSKDGIFNQTNCYIWEEMNRKPRKVVSSIMELEL